MELLMDDGIINGRWNYQWMMELLMDDGIING
jgi:hypothetical protein